jgi:L-2,4-diaminobutyrate decarboxylase
MKNIDTAFNAENFRQQAHELVDILADYLRDAQSEKLEKTHNWMEPEDSLDYWQADFQKPLLDNPNDFFRDVVAKSMHLHHPKYMGHQVSSVAPLAALSGMLTGMLNNGMAVYEMGMVSNPLERIVTDWLIRKMGFDTCLSDRQAEGGGLLTSGGTLANLTALLAARAVKAPNDVWTEGVGERLAVMVSDEAHYCIDRAARIMGLGTAGIIKIPTNETYQMRTELLDEYFEKAQNEGLKVIAVVGSACSTSTGRYDDLVAIGDFCKKHDLWFHVDGAHGGAVAVSEKYGHLLRGVEKADSVIVDFHKMMMIPALCTAVLFKNPEHGFETFQQKAQYLWANQSSKDWFNSGKRTFECTKFMMSVKIYALMRTHGEAVFTEMVDTTYDLGQTMARLLKENPHFELPVEPQSNVVCFRYISDKTTDLNDLNSKIRRQLLENGDFYVVQTTLRGDVYLRVSLMNPQTKERHLIELLDEIEQIAKVFFT